MKVLSGIIFLNFLHLFSVGQDNLTINGKIDLLSESKRIILSSEGGNFEVDIEKDGTFFISGKLSKSNGGLIKTDSSGSNGIWIEPGNYNIKCKEIPNINRNGYYFRITELHGPPDAEIFWGYLEARYYINGTREEMRKKNKDFAIHYLDSLFNKAPQSKVIPEIIRLSRNSIGDEAAQVYMTMLNTEQFQSDDYRMLDNYFKLKEKIAKEVFFANFEMKDQNGKDFKLSSLNKKLILLDFWSSDCAPCRKKHPRLAALYTKYADKGFEIISVSLDDLKEDWLKAISKDNMNWINVSELKGWKTSLAENYFINSIPYSIWLDKDKKIISITDLSEKDIEEYLK